MKIIFKVTTLVLLTLVNSVKAQVQVFACEPEWQALAEELGGSYIKAMSATTAFQDPHHIEARPSLIAKTRKADLIICTGSELEIGWLPLLLRQSGNAKIQSGQVGYFLASEQVDRIEIPEKLDRSMGDVHAGGNPHVHLDPYRLLTIAEKLSERLKEIDPNNQEIYIERFLDFKKRWLSAIQKWQNIAKPLKGKKAVVNHRSWSYLFEWLGMQATADLEPKPGLPPTSSHLVKLLQKIKIEKPDFILVAMYQRDKGALWLSDKSGIPVVYLPFTIDGNKNSSTLFDLYESTISSLLKNI